MATDALNLINRMSDITSEPHTLLMPIEGYASEPLISLEAAVEPLVPLVYGVQQRASLVKHSCESPCDDLSSDEAAAIMLYTAEWTPYNHSLYFILNATLRTEDRQKLTPWLPYLKLLNTALSRLPPIINRTVYRGIRLDLSHLYPQGKTFVWSGFSSCTTSINILEEEHFFRKRKDRTLFVIESISGRDIRRHSCLQNENEVLLLAGTQFTVIARLNQGHHLHIIQLKEVTPSNATDQATIPFNVLSTSNTSSTTEVQQISAHKNTKLDKMIGKCEFHSLVNLERQSLTDRDIPTVAQQAVIDKQCTTLRLSNNNIQSQGAAVLAAALYHNSTLEGLYVFGNRVTDRGTLSFAQVLAVHNFTLKALSLGHNGITDEGAGYLAEMLKANGTLIDLCLPWNRISDCGVLLLANVLTHHNRTLKRLALDLNKLVSDASVEALVDAINRNHSLSAVGVSDCNLSRVGKSRLREATKSKNDIELHT